MVADSPVLAGGRASRLEDGCRVCAAPIVDRSTAGGHVRVVDASDRARTGLKGAGVSGWFGSLEFPLPSGVNTSLHTAGLVIARLGAEEFLVASTAAAADRTVRRLEVRFDEARAGLPSTAVRVPRQSGSACLSFSGAGTATLLSRMCSLDLGDAALPDGAVRQTLVAGSTAILVRDGDELLLFVDASLAAWLADTLVEVAEALS